MMEIRHLEMPPLCVTVHVLAITRGEEREEWRRNKMGGVDHVGAGVHI